MKYVIEHMETGFSEWTILEYSQIIRDLGKENLFLTSLPQGTTEADIPSRLVALGLQWTTQEVIDIVGGQEKAKEVCLLDPRATQDLVPADATEFEYFVFGGILGDHPPRDRTGELRKKYGFAGRRLGKLQMTTDTAIRTTQLIVANKTAFEDIKFIDYPELRFSTYEATEMPFRYVLDTNGKPIFPEGMLELIKNDSEQSIDDLL
ncbi:hypothetical protein BABINDRAFT_41640 [Babjeviella inositovora NRRL Y-12698]|uniref:Uncharacterized protein n=1 Tax=Babjeviella inositovora NRRL Y-12698 TaxID=984486 RepID=A0A1E3QJ77_9ASCO|nr:uncharacterized protein BABINDRAFT_41640 [Babjeviella inositovora NRRL Y-12698]ODQ77504.1 hypothetical protein BABINDRAFT_41640 [Babjeviella inositovora NRRL Y-12698]